MTDQLMLMEWEAWKAMCRVLRTLGVEINKEDALAEAIKQWGEELVTLREAISLVRPAGADKELPNER